MDPSLLIANGSAFQTYLAGDRKLLAESSAIDKAAVDAVVAQQPDILLVNGDETKDGEYVSHIAVSNLLARVAASGTMVYVIPGNHDVNNTNAMSFNGSITTPVPNVTPESVQFHLRAVRLQPGDCERSEFAGLCRGTGARPVDPVHGLLPILAGPGPDGRFLHTAAFELDHQRTRPGTGSTAKWSSA